MNDERIAATVSDVFSSENSDLLMISAVASEIERVRSRIDSADSFDNSSEIITLRVKFTLTSQLTHLYKRLYYPGVHPF